jgi:hypothetical protein
VVTIEEIHEPLRVNQLVKLRRWFRAECFGNRVHGKTWKNEILRTNDFFYSDDLDAVLGPCSIHFLPSPRSAPDQQHPLFVNETGSIVSEAYCFAY